MKELFKELIVDFQNSELPLPTPRNITTPTLPEPVRKAFVFIGMRRSGKTWMLYQIMRDLITQGIDRTKMLYINFEDERLCDMQKKHFQDILEAYFELYPSYLHRSDIHFFFDEIHEIEGWEKFIRRILDAEKMTIYLTGSSCKMLSKEIASSLRGRTFAQEVFPFNFTEYLEKLHVDIPKAIGTKSKIELIHHVQNFLQWGGFPEVIGTTPEIHRTLLQEYLSSVIYRDIIERYGVSNTHALKHLLSHALRNSATMFSISKMYNTLKSMGYEVGKTALYDFMSYFEDAYCVFSLPKFDLSQRKSTTHMKKIFAVDQGLITSVTMSSNFDLAAQLETAVFAYLRRLSKDVFYYRPNQDTEVDFLLLTPDQSILLFQVCLVLKDPETRRREIAVLTTAMSELKIKHGFIITLEEEETIVVPNGKIHVVPVWRLFLEKGL